MPTKHKRVAIIRDSAVDAAISRGRAALGSGDGDAAIARELVIRGARAVGGQPESAGELRQWLTTNWDAQEASAPLGTTLAQAPAEDARRPRKASEILTELRREG
jgi:hypothetical protein